MDRACRGGRPSLSHRGLAGVIVMGNDLSDSMERLLLRPLREPALDRGRKISSDLVVIASVARDEDGRLLGSLAKVTHCEAAQWRYRGRSWGAQEEGRKILVWERGEGDKNE